MVRQNKTSQEKNVTLQGCSVLILRPGKQGESFAASVVRHGGHALVYPMFNIALQSENTELARVIGELEESELVIFVSVNAVKAVVQYMHHHDICFPDSVLVAAIGSTTKSCLEEHGLWADVMPTQTEDSEGLLRSIRALPKKPARVKVFRGEDGRELLYQSLQSDGIDVEHIECYRNIPNSAPIEPVLTEFLQAKTGVICFTSERIMVEMMNRADRSLVDTILAKPVVVFSQRIADACTHYGFHNRIVVAENPSDQGMLAGVFQTLSCG